MDMTQDAANVVINQTLMLAIEGTRMMLTLTGKGAVRVAAIMAAVLQEKYKTRGAVRLASMTRAGGQQVVFTLPANQLQAWAKAAKTYNIMYTVIKGPTDDGMVDLFVRTEDAPRINRVVEKYNLGAVPTAHIESVPAPEQELSQPAPQPSTEELEQETDLIIEEILAGREIVQDETSEIIGEALEQEVPDDYFAALFQDGKPAVDLEELSDPRTALLNENPSGKPFDTNPSAEAARQSFSENHSSQQGNDWTFKRVKDEWPLSYSKDAFDPEQRIQIYKGFEAGLSPEQVEQYAIPAVSAADMERHRSTMRPSVKAAMSRIQQEKAAAGKAAEVLQKATNIGKEL